MARPPQVPRGAGQPYPPDPRYTQPVPEHAYTGPQPPPFVPADARVQPRRPRRRSPIVAPVLAFAGLVLLGAGSLWAVSWLDGILGDGGDTGPAALLDVEESPDPDQTAEPEPADGVAGEPTALPDGAEAETPEPDPVRATAPPIVEPPASERVSVAGTILFARLGDIYAASGTSLRRLTNSDSIRSDASPVWSPDGKDIYFIRTTKKEVRDGRARYKGKYTLYPTDLMRMKPDGSKRTRVYESTINDGRGLWFRHIVQPSVSPRGNNVAVVSDGNDGTSGRVTLHIVNTNQKRMRSVGTASAPRYGHNDPDFHPDGSKIAFTYVDNDGTNGKPKVGVFTCAGKSCTSGRTRYMRSGTANPSWSPDGRMLAVEVTGENGRDIAIFNAKGALKAQLTTDGDSFAPEFSPAGDQVAYLHRDGIDINLRLMTLDIDNKGKITLVDDRPVTTDGLLDGASGLSWFIPKRELRRLQASSAPSSAPEAVTTPSEADDPAADADTVDAPADTVDGAEADESAGPAVTDAPAADDPDGPPPAPPA